MEILLLILIAYLGVRYVKKTDEKIDNLKKENQKLKKEIAILKGEYLETETQDKVINSRPNITSTQTITNSKTLTEEEKNEIKRKKEIEERGRKNTTVLITGAILIVLAAIVFLMSTWNSISNILKTSVLVLLIGVFLGASKIAKERFNLEKASNTFFYLAMAYIPICLISCAVFGLFGQFLSIYGDGKYTYLAISMVFTSFIYYINYKMKNSIPLLYGSILSQILSVIMFGLIFGENILLIAIMLLAYNIILILLTKKNSNIELLKYFYNGIPYVIGIFAISVIFTSNIYMLAILPLLIANYLLLYLKKDNTIFNAYLFNITLYVFGLYFSVIYKLGFEINSGLKVLFGIIYAIITLLVEGITSKNDEKLIKSSMVVSMVSLGILYLKTIIDETSFIKPFIVSGVEVLIMLLVYIKSKVQGKNILSYFIPLTIIITNLHILDECNAGYQIYILTSLIIFVIGEIIKRNELELLNKGFFLISIINATMTYFICSLLYENEFLNDVIFFILLEVVYVYSFLKNRENIIFKYLGYTTFGIILLTGINFLAISEELKLLIPLIVTITSLILERKYEKLKDNFSPIFISILSIITYITLIQLDSISGIVIGLMFSTYLIFDNFKSNDNKYLRIIPMIGFLVLLFKTYIETEIITGFLLLATIAITFISIYQKEFSIETIFSGIYLLLTLDNFEIKYIQEIIFIIWSFSNMYFMKNEKVKDIFKALMYLGVFVLYNNLLEELNMNTLSCWTSIGVMILSILYLRKIIIKYLSSIDSIEYLVYSIIYLFAIGSYIDEMDGILFVLFIVALVMYSYVKKYGSLFIVSIFAILINAILLTREFWLSIPWWIYLLLIGTILIAFAIKNESDDKKEKLNVGNVIKKIKDKIEK